MTPSIDLWGRLLFLARVYSPCPKADDTSPQLHSTLDEVRIGMVDGFQSICAYGERWTGVDLRLPFKSSRTKIVGLSSIVALNLARQSTGTIIYCLSKWRAPRLAFELYSAQKVTVNNIASPSENTSSGSVGETNLSCTSFTPILRDLELVQENPLLNRYDISTGNMHATVPLGVQTRSNPSRDPAVFGALGTVCPTFALQGTAIAAAKHQVNWTIHGFLAGCRDKSERVVLVSLSQGACLGLPNTTILENTLQPYVETTSRLRSPLQQKVGSKITERAPRAKPLLSSSRLALGWRVPKPNRLR